MNTQPLTRAAYRLSEAAKMLGVSRTTLYRKIDEGQIKTMTICNMRRITVDEINRLLGRTSADAAGRR